MGHDALPPPGCPAGQGTASPRATAGRVDPGVHEFLQQLRQRHARTGAAATHDSAMPDCREVSAAEDVIGRFAAAAHAAGCQVQRVQAGHVCRSAAELLARLAVRSVVLEPRSGTALPAEAAGDWQAALAGHGIQVTADRSDATLFDVGAAITGVELAVAETGTLVCTSGPDRARGTSLIPPVHVAVVHASQIVPDLFDAFEHLAAGELPTNVNLITGPSKTADIEGVLVTGVHGPGEVHVLVIS